MSGPGQAPAGWYPTPDGLHRYWDGQAWTDQARQPEQSPSAGSNLKAAFAGAAERFTARDGFPEGSIWSAVGKPLTGVGAGRYWMDDRYLYFEKGTLRTDSQQVLLSDVVDVDVNQTMAQKARGVFTLSVHVQRAGHREIVVMVDIPDGRAAQRTINDAAHAARAALQRAQNTVRYEGQVAAPIPAAVPQESTPPQSGSDDFMEKLKQLGEMKTAGLLTDEEFAAAKAKLLA